MSDTLLPCDGPDMTRRAVLASTAVWLATAATVSPAQTAAWPTRLIQIIVPIGAGGGADTMLRTISPSLTQALGQTILLNNKPGANSIIGTEALARSAPDGYTFGWISDQFSINQQLVKLPYANKDFAPVTQLVEGYFVLLASPGIGFRTLKDLIADAKANPGKYSYATPGTGSPHHLAMESLSKRVGIEMRPIPFQGTPQMVTDVMGGHVDLMLLGVTSALELVRSGKLMALAVTGPERLPTAPEIPTASEAGATDFVATFWYGLLAPAGTPPHIVARMSQEVGNALRDPKVQKQLASIDLIARPSTPEEFTAFIKKDIERYAGIIKQSGIKAEGG